MEVDALGGSHMTRTSPGEGEKRGLSRTGEPPVKAEQKHLELNHPRQYRLGRRKGNSPIFQVVLEKKTKAVGKVHGPPSKGVDKLPLNLRDPEPEGSSTISRVLSKNRFICVVVVVYSLSDVRLFATPRTAARQASPSFTIPQSLLKLISFDSSR